LFRGHLAQYWALIVLAIAFLGVGLSELFSRRGVPVLAEPLGRTAMLLPLLPLVLFWLRVPDDVRDTASRTFPGLTPLLGYLPKGEHDFLKYALVWFLAGGLYTVFAFTRRSFRFGLIAALAANFGLWALFWHWQDEGLGFLTHPQLWIIPLCLIALVSEYINR